ncbi:MAG: hemagglutinin repeat-containing protein, partial [Azovibrio sp.]
RLIREQIGQLTGRRFLEGYADDEAQYQALLENGVLYAQEHQLIPGISLSAAQMAQLTSDIVWLVEQTITLADGTTTRALVPQVYMRVQEGDLAPGGAMIAGNQVYMNLEQDLTNRGLISGRELVDLNGRTLNNLGGHIQAATVWLTAQEDIVNIGGHLQAANSLVADAGRDIHMETTTASTETRSKRGVFQITNVDQVASVYVSAPGANLELNAGRDITLTGAQIQNDGDSILISAGRDLNLNTVAVADHTDITRSKRNYVRFGQDAEVGTRITLGGAQAEIPEQGELGPFASSMPPQLTLLAGNDIKARAAMVDSAGALTLVAGQNVSIEAGMTDHYVSTASYASGSNAFSSSSAESRSFRSSSRAQGSSFGGDTVNIQAGQDFSLLGSHVIADKDLLMTAGRDINITAATESTRQSDYRKEKNSGAFGTGGMGFTIGKQEQSTDGKGTATYAAASTVGSIGGDITLVAGRNYTQTGSHIVTPVGDVGIAADQILIQEARETSTYEQKVKFKQSGLTLSAGSPLITAVQTAEQMSNAAGDSDDPRTKALALASTAISGYNAYQAMSRLSGSSDPMSQMGGLTISLNLGKSESESLSWQRSNTAAGSSIAAGGNIILLANTENRDGNITIQGSNLTANKNMTLVADRDINLLASRNTYEQGSKNRSSSSSVGISYGASGNGVGFSVSASSNKSSGHANGNGLEWTNTHLLAGDTLTLISGNDLTLRGATARGDTLLASVGGNLIIESLQDTDNYKSEQKSSGFSLSIPLSMGGRPSASISKGQTDIDSNYRSVIEQSALKAGDGGFIVDVGGNTTLIGGAILSTQEAIDRGNNSFNTDGELTLIDLKNKAEYEGTSYSVNLGAVPSTDGKLTPEGSGFGFGKESGEASSTTYAAISGIAGKEEARTGDKESGIEKIFDADEVERKLKAKVETTHMFGQLAPKAVAEFAQSQYDQIVDQAKALAESDPEQSKALFAEAARWNEGGAYRVALHTALGGLAGGMEGALGAGATAQAADLLSQLQDNLASSLKDAGMDGSLANAAGSLIAKITAAGLGNALGGTPGAGMGLNVEANNRQLHDSEKERIKKLSQETGISEERLEAAACAKVNCWAQYSSELPEFMEGLLKAQRGMNDQEALAVLNKEIGRDSSFLLYTVSDDRDDYKKMVGNSVLSSTKGFIKGFLSTGKDAHEILMGLYSATNTPTDFPVNSDTSSSYWDEKDVTTPSNQVEADSMLAGRLTAITLVALLSGGRAKPNTGGGVSGVKGGVTAVDEAVAGPVNFMGSSDQFFINASKRLDVDANGFFDVVAHGSTHKIEVMTKNGTVLVDQRVAARLIQNAPGYNGQPIRLLSCDTGACTTGMAQNLANKMGVSIEAPSDLVWAYGDGRIVVAPRLSSDPRSPLFNSPDLANQGTFVTFVPRKVK